jgi:hypothetical protein
VDIDAPHEHAPPKDGDPWTTLLTPELEADKYIALSAAMHGKTKSKMSMMGGRSRDERNFPDRNFSTQSLFILSSSQIHSLTMGLVRKRPVS